MRDSRTLLLADPSEEPSSNEDVGHFDSDHDDVPTSNFYSEDVRSLDSDDDNGRHLRAAAAAPAPSEER
eukprot:184676-Heterocapsa_arctica.AAC.1